MRFEVGISTKSDWKRFQAQLTVEKVGKRLNLPEEEAPLPKYPLN